MPINPEKALYVNLLKQHEFTAHAFSGDKPTETQNPKFG